jgi:hypothetical protein
MSINYNQTLQHFQRVAAPAECTGEEFLQGYVKWMRLRARVRASKEYIHIAKWVENHWENQVKHVYRLFPGKFAKRERQ